MLALLFIASPNAPLLAPRTSRGALRSSRRARRRAPSAAPCMLLGLPRVFGTRTRTADTQQLQHAAPPPPPPPSAPPAHAAAWHWARAHPLQAAGVLALATTLLRRALSAAPARHGAAGTERGAAAPRRDAAAPNSARTLRAVPRAHESTEEALDLLSNTARKYIIVGGKGGVGKTSMSAAVATAFADRAQTTLIVSTDPAHSLSDAFGQSVSGGDPVAVMGIDNLYAQEVDPDSMKATFKMMQQMEGAGAMQDMGLDDLNSLFDTIPPGFDEAVALVEIVKYIEADAQYAKFDRIVFDTAPTGHTLRLLALPDFLNGFFGKMISMKSKMGNVMNQFKGMFGGGAEGTGLDSSVEDMEELKRSMNMVRELFRDQLQTEFIVATIPNMMAISESQRLLQELRKERIPVRHLFVNQLQPENEQCSFCAARFKEQQRNMRFLESEFSSLQIATVQSFDKEIKGAAALRAMGAQLFPHSREQHASANAAAAGGAQPPQPPPPQPPQQQQQQRANDSSGAPPRRASAELVE